MCLYMYIYISMCVCWRSIGFKHQGYDILEKSEKIWEEDYVCIISHVSPVFFAANNVFLYSQGSISSFELSLQVKFHFANGRPFTAFTPAFTLCRCGLFWRLQQFHVCWFLCISFRPLGFRWFSGMCSGCHIGTLWWWFLMVFHLIFSKSCSMWASVTVHLPEADFSQIAYMLKPNHTVDGWNPAPVDR